MRNLALVFGAAALTLLAPASDAAKARTASRHHPSQASTGASKAPAAAEPPAPAQKFHGLLAANEAEVKSRIGSPDVARGEGAGAMWTYRLPDCALFVFFRLPKGAAAGDPIRVSGAASGPRVRGRQPLPVNDCIAQAQNRQAATAASNMP
jgi:hypothetical protein